MLTTPASLPAPYEFPRRSHCLADGCIVAIPPPSKEANIMTTRRPWTDQENRALIALYFRMLDRAVAGKPYNKAAMIRELTDVRTPQLPMRSKHGIEAKLMNATACHARLAPNDETMNEHGYRALPNYQKSLLIEMQRQLELRAYEHDAQITKDVAALS